MSDDTSALPAVTMLYRRHDTNVSATNNDLMTVPRASPSAPRLSRNTNSLGYKLRYRAVVLANFLGFVARYHLARMHASR